MLPKALTRPGSLLLVSERSRTKHSSGSRLRRCCCRGPCPLSKAQKTVGSLPCPLNGGLSRLQIYGLRLTSCQLLVGSRPRRLRPKQRVQEVANQNTWLYQLTLELASCTKSLCERTLLVKGCLILYHMITGARQLVRYRLAGDNPIGLGFLTLIKPADTLIVAHHMIRRLDKRPR